MHTINIKDTLKLYNKYTNDYRESGSKRYLDFSNHCPFSSTTIFNSIKEYSWDGDRDGICSILKEYSIKIGASDKSLENIERLSNSNCLAVVTGHQPALFGGALFVLLKIASIISLVNKLNSESDEYDFVPIFWNASEDHNSSEFTSVSSFDSANDLKNIKLTSDNDSVMSSEITPDNVGELIEEVISILPQTEFIEDIREELLTSYTSTIGESFSRLISKWFSSYGLIIIEPKYLRKLATPVISQALINHNELVKNMKQDSGDMITEGYSLQLPDASEDNTFVFYVEDGKRLRIKYDEGSYIIPELEESYSLEQILALVNNEPEKFSPVAGLRPVVQGSVFPAPIYVAGGGELAYHYQLRRNFKTLNQALPLILPRAAGTFITPSILKALRTFSIDEKNILTSNWSWEDVEKGILEASSELNNAFTEYYTDFSNTNKRLISNLTKLSLTNLNELKKEMEKFTSRTSKIQKRMAANTGFDGNGSKNKYFKMRKFLLPGNKYQELSIAGLYFYSLLGKQFFDTICEVDLFSSDHKLWIFD